jgi:hypothetical protein
MSSLRDISDADLRAELSRREAERKAIEEAERRDRLQKENAAKEALFDLIRANRDVFLNLVPEHSRTSCSDDHPQNPDRNCTRCALLILLRKEGWHDPDDFQVQFTLELRG